MHTDVIGTRFLLYGLVISSLLGAVVTWFFRIETAGVNLDQIGELAAGEPEKSKAIA